MQCLQQQHCSVDAEVSCQRTSYSAKLCCQTLSSPQVFCQHGRPYTPLHYHHMLSYSTSTPPLNAITCYHTAPHLCYQMPYYSIISLPPHNLIPWNSAIQKQPLQLFHPNWHTRHEIILYFFKSVKKYNIGQKYYNYQITNPCW